MLACTGLKLNKVACTSKLCEWKKARKRAHPAPLHKINFKRPKKEDKLPQVDGPFTDTLTGYYQIDPVKFCTENQRRLLKSLKNHTPKAAVLTCVSKNLNSDDELTVSNDEETDTASETEENTLPELLTSFYDPCSVNYPTEKITEIGKNKYNNYQKHNNEIHYKNLEKITTDQSLSTKWMYYRAGRVTSSNAKKGYTMDVNNPAVSTVNSIMQYNKAFTTKEMEYGKKSESKAFENFYELMKTKHINFNLENTGLHINKKYVYLGASPDGLTSCDCHGKGVLEIKCPYKFRNGLKDYMKSKTCPVSCKNKLKQSHEYYFQVQMQMLVTERCFCNFFVWSKNDWLLIHVEKNEEFCKKLLCKLEQVFMKVILKELVTRDADPENEKRNQLYCYCNRPSIKPMIAFDNSKCKYEWFHYSCVNLVRTPAENSKWYCPDCSKIFLKNKKCK